MAHRVVCILRVTAAGGEAIGQRVAERLGFRYVDDEVIELAAKRAGLDPAVVESAERHRGLLSRLMDALIATPPEVTSYFPSRPNEYYPGSVAPAVVPPPEKLRRLIQDAIVEIARRGKAVIGAHAASIALRGTTDVLRVHVVASVPTRVRRLWLQNKLLSEEEFAKSIAESDHQRAKYLERFYDIHDEAPTRYDVVINTDALDVEQAAAAIVAIATS
jgi:hypothetical protein